MKRTSWGNQLALRHVEEEMKEARSYAEWKDAAKRHDKLTGADDWRENDVSPFYDYKLIRRRLGELQNLRKKGDDKRLLFTLNEGIHGNLGGMGRSVLYDRAKFGTKRLVVDYVDAVVEAIEHLATETSSGITPETKRDFFERASLCFGHTALMLSGSGTMFFFHLGVLRALVREDLLPRVLSGSSGGAMIASLVGSRPPEERASVLDLEVFREFIGPRRLIPSGFDREVRAEALDAMNELLPDMTFAEAHARSGLAINISVAPLDHHQRSRLLNAISSPHVIVREAVLASAAFPGMFPAVTLMAKTADGERRPYLPERKWLDGSISDDLPAKRITRLFGVNHFRFFVRFGDPLGARGSDVRGNGLSVVAGSRGVGECARCIWSLWSESPSLLTTSTLHGRTASQPPDWSLRAHPHRY